MYVGYCIECKAKRPIADVREETMKSGRKAAKGKCPECGADMFKIIGCKLGEEVGECHDGEEAPPGLGGEITDPTSPC